MFEIRKYPEKILRQRCQIVKQITEKEVQLFHQMLTTMQNFSGIGLAAPQVGISQKLFVVDIGEGAIFMANPEMVAIKGKEKMEEGCLSVPGAQVNIERSAEIVVRGLNKEGKVVEIKAKGLLARVFQHEIDHLNGKLIIDYMSFWQKLKFNLGAQQRR